MTRVTKIEIRPSTLQLQEGEFAIVEAYLEPSNANYTDIVWTIDNPDIATVNTGHILAKKRGTAKVKAVSLCDVSVIGECTLTVTAPKRVQSISFPQKEYTMVLGTHDYIYPVFTPSDTVNRELSWCSCNEDIVYVDDGVISARGVGTTTIIATTADGSHTARCTVRVVLDNVTIKQDGGFKDVIFEKSGKTWKCIEHDMLYGTSEIDTSFLIGRCNYNYFKYPDQIPIHYDYKEYTDDELKLLYAIDPYGVAEYINRYADRVVTADPTDTRENALLYAQLKYKDERYEAIFGEKPKYFKRRVTNQIEWVETTDTNNIEAVLSASESLFGFRKVDDEISYWAKREFNFKVIKAIASCLFNSLINKIDELKDFLDDVDPYVKLFEISVIMTEDDCAEELVKYSSTQVISKLLSYTNLSWDGEALSLIDDLSEMDRASIPDVNFCGKITACYAESVYNITLETSNSNRFPMKDIHEAIAMLN